MADQPDIPWEGFDRYVGLHYERIGPDGVTATLEVRPELLQPYGILHGGVLCSAVESVGSVAAGAWFGDRGHVVGTANHTNFLRAVREGTLTATASPVHRGRTQQLWQVDVTDADGRLVARGELRLANITSAERLGHTG